MERDVDQLKKIYRYCDNNGKLCKKLQQSLKLRNRKRLKSSSSGSAGRSGLKRGLRMMDDQGKTELFGQWLKAVGNMSSANCPFGSIKELSEDFESGKIKDCPARREEDEESEVDEDFKVDAADFEF